MDFKYGLMFNFFLALVAIANPIGKIPCWLRAVEDEKRGVELRLAWYLIGTSSVILIGLVWFHEEVLNFFGLTIASFKVGGGIVIFLTGYAMLNGKIAEINHKAIHSDDFSRRAKYRFRETMVPLVIPLIAGPGSMSTTVIYASRANGPMGYLSATISVLAVLTVLFLTLISAKRLHAIMGDTVLAVFTRTFGFILTAMSAQLLIEGLGESFPGWLES